MSSGGHQLSNTVYPVPYQIDFSVDNKGRHLDSTKRKIIWKFGFAHPPAVFPHLFDAHGNRIGDNNGGASDGSSIVPYPENNPKKGVECRGREHEVMLTWSLLTGKVHIYVDSREIYRNEPVQDEVCLNPWASRFHRGFDLPNPKFNGRHRIDIRCYARTPMGAKNMVVDSNGGKFRQYDLSVDGLSYFSFPAMYEMGTDRMWNKVSRWGLNRAGSQGEEEAYHGGGSHGEHRTTRSLDPNSGGFEQQTGRAVDQYHFDKANRKSSSKNRYGQSIDNKEYKAMNPRTESEEDRMMRFATEASLKDWDKDHNKSSSHRSSSASSSEENNSASGNRKKGRKSGKKSTKKMASIGEDNLIDFGTDDATRAMSHITISRQATDISVLADADDDATTASFMMNTAWGSNGLTQQPPPPATINPGQMYNNQQQPPQYQDPTFRSPYAQQPPTQPKGYVGSTQQPTPPATMNPGQMYNNQQQPPQYHDPTFGTPYLQQPPQNYAAPAPAVSPRNNVGLPSDASFAMAPPPTWDDYKQAFGGSTVNMSASVVGGGSTMMINPMSPASSASVGMASPMAQQQPAQSQYSMQQQQQVPQQQLSQQWQSQTFGAAIPSPASAQTNNRNKFDPLSADPFFAS